MSASSQYTETTHLLVDSKKSDIETQVVSIDSKLESYDDDNLHADEKLGVVSASLLMLNKMIGTGIFSVPSSVYALTGSVGGSMFLWMLGGIAAYAGLNVYLEFGLKIPKSGGDKNYLERVYRHPRHFALAIFTVVSVFLGVSSSNCYAFGIYVLFALGIENPTESQARSVAILGLTLCCCLHGVFPNAGRRIFNLLGIFKVVVLIGVTITGLGVLAGLVDIPDRPHNFTNIFQNDGYGGGAYSYSVALLRVFYSYRGWENANFVMGQIRNPERTVPIAGTLAIVLATLLYSLCNIAYFAVIPKDLIANSGTIVAGHFFRIVFGESAAARLLPCLVALSNIGNVLVVSYAYGYMNLELAKNELLPFSNFFSSLKPFNSPFAGLGLHWVISALTLIIPPPGQIYEFVIDLSSYPLAIITAFVTVGLLYLQFNREKEDWPLRPFHSPLVLTLIYLFINIFLILAPLVPPPPGVIQEGQLPYYSVPLASVIIFILGGVYWSYWFQGRDEKEIEVLLE